MNEILKHGIAKLKNDFASKKGQKIKMLIGLDGFVDEIIHVVDKRMDFQHFERIATIRELGEKISRAAGLSANIEFVPVHVKLGGNGPIFANALIEYGVDMTYTGAVGKPSIHPVFQNMASRSTVYPLCDPGHTDALEFNDGKLMLGKIEVLNELTWDSFKEAFGGVEKLAEIVSECDLFGMENWTMIPHMSDIWEGIIMELFPLIKTDKRQIAFFDLADPEKRTKADILNALELIGKFSEKFVTILGLNEKEVYEIIAVYDIEVQGESNAEKLKFTTEAVYEKLNIDCLVVHPTKEAVCRTKNGYFHTEGPFCKNPKLTTGAGDNFNAGFCFAQSLGLNEECSLMMGVATSGFYVRNAKSPTTAEVQTFLNDWENGNI